MGKSAQTFFGLLRTLVAVMFTAMTSLASATSGAGITYLGRLLRDNGTPVDGNAVQFVIQIRSPGPENCLMYQETHVLDLTSTAGVFAISINDGTATVLNTEPFTLDRVFQNRGTFNFGTGKCAAVGSYTPGPADGRRLIVNFNDGTFAGWEPLPEQQIAYVPMSIESMTVGGFKAGNLLRVTDGTGEPAAVSALTQTQYTELMNLVNGSSSQYWNAGSIPDGSITDPKIASISGSKVTGNIPGYSAGFLGSMAGDVTGTQGATSVVRIQGRNVDTATPADGQVLKWNQSNNRWEPAADAGLTTVDWSVVTGKPSVFPPSGHTHPADQITSAAGIYFTYKPNNVACTDGQVMKWNTAGQRWECGTDNVNAGTVTSIATGTGLTGGTITSSGTIALADTTVTPGAYGSSTQVPTFTVDQQGRLVAAGQVTITGTAPGGSAGGDLTGSFPNPTIAAGAVTGTKIASNTITTSNLANGTAAGQSYRYNGTSWQIAKLNYTDLVNSFAVTPWPTTTCASGSFMTWQSTTDSFACTALTGANVAAALGYTPLGNSLANGQMWIGNASGVPTAVTMSGDATISNSGVITLSGLDWSKITSGKPTTLSGYGITDAISNAGGAPSVQEGAAASMPTAGTAGRLFVATDAKKIYRDNGTTWDLVATTSAADLGGTMNTAQLPVVPVAKGGTGLSTVPTNGQLLIGNGTGYTLGNLTAGSGVNITNSAGSVTITATGSGGTVTNVSGTAPVSVATGTTTPVISISQANTTTDGYLSSADWNTFNNKLGTTSTFGGDVSGTSSTTSVDKLKGTALSITSLTSGQYLKYDGTNWLNSNIAATDITSGTLSAARLPAFSGDVTSTAGSSTLTLNTVPIGKGGTGLTAGGTGNQVLGMNAGATGLEYKTLTAGSGVSISNSAGAVTITATGSGGTVTSVTSANSDIAVATGTTTPVLTLNSGTGANQIVKLDGSAKLPAVDGSALTNLNASNLASGTLPAARLPALTGDVTSVAGSNSVTLNTVATSKGGTGLTSIGTANQMLGVNAGATGLEYKTITAGTGVSITNSAGGMTINATGTGGTVTSVGVSVPAYMTSTGGPVTSSGTIALGFGSQSAKSVFAAPQGAAGAPVFRNLGIVDIQSSVSGSFFTASGACPSGQMLTYSSVNDNISCAAYTLTGSQVTTALGGTPVLNAGGAPSVQEGLAASIPAAGTAGRLYVATDIKKTYRDNGTTWDLIASTDASDLTGTMNAAQLPVVPVAKGGTGLSAAPTNGQIPIGNGTGYTLGTLTAGTGVTITNSAGGITINAAGSGGTVTNVTGTAPISVATGSTTPAISISQANGTTNGYLSSTDWTTFNNKLGTASTFSGDVSGTSSTMSVDKLKGTALAITGLTSWNFLKYNGTNWVNSNIAASDIPNLDWSKITTGKPTTISGYGITDAVQNAGGVPSVSSGTEASRPAAGTAGRIYVATDTKRTFRDNGTTWDQLDTNASDLASGTLPTGRLPAFTGDVTSSAGSNSLTLNTVSLSKGGTGLTAGGTANQVLGMNAGATGLEYKTITAGTGVSITNSAGGMTINATGSGGTVTSVSSANSDIAVATGTTTPVLTLNSGTGANQIVKLDGSAKLPAVDGSALTNVNATKLAGTAVTITTLTSGNFLKYNGTAWVNATPSSADLSDAGSLIKSSQMPANCGAGQTLTFSSPTGAWTCSNITVTASNFGSQSANTVLAAPNGSAGTPSFRSLVAADLPAGTVSGSGTTGYLPYYSGASTLANSPVFASGTNIGVNITSPLAKVHAVTADAAAGLIVSGATNLMRVTPQTGNVTLEATNVAQNAYAPLFLNGLNLQLGVGGAEAMRIIPGGYVGIGTTNPAYNLDVNGTARATQLCIGTDCRSAWPSGGGGGSGTVTSVATGTGLTGGPITTTGTISVDVGTTASKIPQLDANGRYPATTGLVTSTKDNITTRTDSGFFQTGSATTANGWPATTNDWYHLISSTHTNDANYYAMQFAGNFHDSNELYYRATNASGTTAWNKVWHSGNLNPANYQTALGYTPVNKAGDTMTGNLSFSAANPTIGTGGSYIQIPNGIYVSGGTPYFQNQIQARGGVHNDNAAYLQLDGGTSGITYVNGSLGVGTTAPTASLQVLGGIRARGGPPASNGTNNNGYAFNGNSGDNDSGMFSSADGQVEFYSNAVEAFRIAAGGNVGIGSTTPGQKLDVAGNIASSGDIYSATAGGWLSTLLAAKQGSLGYTPVNKAGDTMTGNLTVPAGLQLGNGISQGLYGDGGNIALRTYNSAGSDIYFQTYNGAATNMIIKNNGNVGIGVNPPSQKLEVGGNVKASGLIASTLYTASNTGYYLYDDAGNGGWRANNNFLVNGNIYFGAKGKWLDTVVDAKLDNRAYQAAGINFGGDGGPMVYSTVDGSNNSTGAAMISFHRPGAYAVNFGLDTDNQLKVGGWSMGNAAYTIWHSGNFNPASASVNYANSAGTANNVAWGNVSGKPFNYSGQGGQPSWLWGTNDGSNYYVWNPSNFSVNYANSAGSANSANSANTAAVANKLVSQGAGNATFNWSGQGGQPSWLWGSNDGVNMYVWNPANFNVNYANMAGGMQTSNGIQVGDINEYGRIVNNGGGNMHLDSVNGNIYLGWFNGGGTTIIGNGGQNYGTIQAASFQYASDIRLKKNVVTLEDPLAKVLGLRGVRFNWKSDNKPEVGFIAQEVEKVVPELVATMPDEKLGDVKSVKYGNITALLVEAVKEVWAKVTGHDERLQKLEAENADLKARLDRLEKLVGTGTPVRAPAAEH